MVMFPRTVLLGGLLALTAGSATAIATWFFISLGEGGVWFIAELLVSLGLGGVVFGILWFVVVLKMVNNIGNEMDTSLGGFN